MRINEYIKHHIIGKDATLTMFDLAWEFYDTRFPTKEQRYAINRAIAIVADGLDVIAINTNEKGYKLAFNPHSDKSVCLASSKRGSKNAGAFSTDEVVWNKLRFVKNGHSFDQLDSRVKTLALIARARKAGNPELAEQIEKDARARAEARLTQLNDGTQGNPAAPTEAEAKKALITLYKYAMTTNDLAGFQGEHEGKLLKFTIEDK